VTAVQTSLVPKKSVNPFRFAAVSVPSMGESLAATIVTTVGSFIVLPVFGT
jgi:hypothetical protein